MPSRPGQFNRYSYTYNDPINAMDPFGLDAHLSAWLVSRPVIVFGIPTGNNHSFIVVAERLGGPIDTRFSYGPDGSYLKNLVPLGIKSATNRDDISSWEKTGSLDNVGVIEDRRINYIKINAPVDIVITYGNAVSRGLESEDTDYDILPGMQNSVNSNSGIWAVSNGAINHGRPTPLTPLVQPSPGVTNNNPGHGESGEVPVRLPVDICTGSRLPGVAC